ncbi:MAG: ATP-binding cassette domain-containing protein, partial [Psychrobacillus psychrodurans]
MLKVDKVQKSYKKNGLFSSERQIILKNVSLECRSRECLGIIGESGSGKSTLGRLMLGIEKPDCGTVLIDGMNVEDRRVRLGNISAVFQDYKSSINPFFTVQQAIMESLRMVKEREENQEKQVEIL